MPRRKIIKMPKKKQPAVNLKDINGIWDFLAWFINLIASDPKRALKFFAALGLILGFIFGGFSLKTAFFEYEQEPVPVDKIIKEVKRK